MAARALKPRQPVVTAVLAVTTFNCGATIGVDPRRFRELVATKCPGRFRVGKIVGAPLDEVLDALRSMSAPGTEEDDGDGATGDVADHGDAGERRERAPASVDEVLRRAGLRRAS